MVKRNYTTKTLVYPDGTQELIAIGMVDSNGLMAYMMDTENTQYFKFDTSNNIIAQLAEERDAIETAERRATQRADILADDLRVSYLVCDKAIALCEEMLAKGDFGTPHRRGGLSTKLKHIKNQLPEKEERWL